jgi:hypothetical protein
MKKIIFGVAYIITLIATFAFCKAASRGSRMEENIDKSDVE